MATLTFKFVLKLQKSERYTLAARLYENGKSKDIPLGVTLDDKKLFSNQRVKNDTATNLKIRELQDRFDTYMDNCKLRKATPEINAAYAHLLGEERKSGYTISDAIDNYCTYYAEGLKADTIDKYTLFKNVLDRYEEYRQEMLIESKGKINLSPTNLDTLTNKFLHDFCQFRVVKESCSNTTINKNKSFLNGILEFACTEGEMIKSFPTQFKVKLETIKPSRFPLTDDELEMLKKYSKQINRLNITAANGRNEGGVSVERRLHLDAFLFSCETGLRHSDLLAIKPMNVIIKDGKQMLCFTAKKGEEKEVLVPLSLFAQVIIGRNKAENNAPIFKDLPTGQTLNERLKTILSDAGLNRLVEVKHRSGKNTTKELLPLSKIAHIHLGRHTFATRLINSGVPLNFVKEVLSHGDIATTMKYVHTASKKATDKVLEALDAKADNKSQSPMVKAS